MKKQILFGLLLLSGLVSLISAAQPAMPTIPDTCYSPELKQSKKGDWYVYARCCVINDTQYVKMNPEIKGYEKCVMEHGEDWQGTSFNPKALTEDEKGPHGRALYYEAGTYTKAKVKDIGNKTLINKRGHLRIPK